MKPSSRIKIILPTAFVTLLLFATCTKTDDYSGPCGDKKQWAAHKETMTIINSSYNYADSMRTVIFQDAQIPTDICADDEPTATFNVNVKNSEHNVYWSGKAYWGGIFGTTKYLGVTGIDSVSKGSDNVASGSFIIGLKQAYPSGPASVALQMVAVFKTFGSDSLDRIKVYEDLSTMDITLDYRVFK